MREVSNNGKMLVDLQANEGFGGSSSPDRLSSVSRSEAEYVSVVPERRKPAETKVKGRIHGVAGKQAAHAHE